MTRKGRVERGTKETQVLVEIDLDGTGQVDVATGVGFFDHMLAQLGKHGSFDLTVKTAGDLHIDSHHTIEDTAIALGQAFREALGDKAGIRRFADASIPLDEALAQVTVDVSGRPYLVHVEPEGMAPQQRDRRQDDDDVLEMERRVDEQERQVGGGPSSDDREDRRLLSGQADCSGQRERKDAELVGTENLDDESPVPVDPTSIDQPALPAKDDLVPDLG